MARPEDREPMSPRGAIVKYNSCTKHARGSRRLYFDAYMHQTKAED